MVATAMIRHVILGKGNFGPITYDAVEIPEMFPGTILKKTTLEKLEGCKSDFSKLTPPSPPPSLPFTDISIIFMTAAPGSGKSALCQRLLTRFPTLAHIS